MPDSNINTGVPLKWSNAGVIRFGTAGGGYTVLQVQPGSLKITEGGRTNIAIKDRAKYNGTVIPGGEQMSEISFAFRLTDNGMTAASDMLQQIYGTGTPASDGQSHKFTFQVDWPTSEGASTGTRASFANTFAAGGHSISESEEDSDIIEVTLNSATARATWSSY